MPFRNESAPNKMQRFIGRSVREDNNKLLAIVVTFAVNVAGGHEEFWLKIKCISVRYSSEDVLGTLLALV